MALVAVAGIQHETNTFAPTKAGLDAFKTGGSRPPLTTGPDLFSRVKGKNLPIAGFVERIEALDHIAYPLTWGAAGAVGHGHRTCFRTYRRIDPRRIGVGSTL